MTMRAYLSHGMGVNSTALMLLLEDQGIKFESVFVDHGGDYPETYGYLKYLQDQGYEITVIKPEVEGCSTIEEYCWKHSVKPMTIWKWCTDKFKLRPLKNHMKSPCIEYIGIDAGEKNRLFNGQPLHKDNVRYFPLIDEGIDRAGCIKLIQDHGLKLPPKSGCFFCPHARVDEIKKLRLYYPELYERRRIIYENADINYSQKVNNQLTVFDGELDG